VTRTSPRARGTKKRCPKCKKLRRFRGQKLSDRRHGPAWYRGEDGVLICYICHPERLLEVECPYTSCNVPPGIECRSAADGSVLIHGHPERRVEARRLEGAKRKGTLG